MRPLRPLANLLVTGGAGFIGSAFIRYLFGSETFTGHILNLDLLTYAAHLDALSGISSRYQFVQGDIGDQALVEQLLAHHRIDAVVHFAAETHVDRSIACAYPFIETNVKGTLSLLEAIRKFPSIHFHHISTDEVYGSLGESGFFNEQSPYRPNSPYSASKAASDHLVRAFAHTYGLSVTMSHCSNNYGPWQYPEKFIPLMISHCLQGRALPVYGEGANRRDWLYVEDHADAIWKILQFGKSGESYGIGGGVEISNLQLLYRIIQLLSQEIEVEPARYLSLIRFVQDRPGHDFRYAIDTTKIERELGWQPRTSLDEGLKKTIRWYAERDRVELSVQ
jgi:dTDP-glucose 4,6-dehydratase